MRIGQVQQCQSQVETSRRPGRKRGQDRLELFRGPGVLILLEQCGAPIELGQRLDDVGWHMTAALSVSRAFPHARRLPGAAGNRRREVRP